MRKPTMPRVWRDTQEAIEAALLPIKGAETVATHLSAPDGMALVFTVRVAEKERKALTRWFVRSMELLGRETRKTQKRAERKARR